MSPQHTTLIGAHLFDDRSKTNYILIIHDVLFEDEDVALCLCYPESTSPTEPEHPEATEPAPEKILVDKHTGAVAGQDYAHWLLNR